MVNLLQFGFGILFSADEKFKRNVSVAGVKWYFHNKSVDISNIKIISEFSKWTMSSNQIKLEFSKLAIFPTRGKIFKVSVCFLNDGKVFIFVSTSKMLKLVVNDWHKIFAPDSSDSVILAFTKWESDEEAYKYTQVSKLIPIVFPIPLRFMFEKSKEAFAQALWFWFWDSKFVTSTFTILSLNALLRLIGDCRLTSSGCARIRISSVIAVGLETIWCLSFVIDVEGLMAWYFLDMYNKSDDVAYAYQCLNVFHFLR